MLALNVYGNIIYQIRSSNLNFQLQISPFSAHISFKRSVARDRSGAFLLPPEVSLYQIYAVNLLGILQLGRQRMRGESALYAPKMSSFKC